MRPSLYLTLTIFTIALFFSCRRELSFEAGQISRGSLQSASGDCLPKNIGGIYKATQVLNDSNYLEVTINVTQPGTYNIHTDTANGYSFHASGSFANTGLTTVRLNGIGKPLAPENDDFTVFYDTTFCSVIVVVQDAGASSGGSAIYTLQGSGGTCMNYSLATATYAQGTPLTTANKVTISVNVSTIGTWSITTAAVDGFSYSGSGTFTATGVQNITLQGSGTPAAGGSQTFTVAAGSASCTFPVTVSGGSPAACATPQGTYTAGTALAGSNKISVQHTYAATGNYNLSTNTVNGYSFGPATTNITAAGTLVTLTLNGTGTPAAAGSNTFIIDFGDGTNCSFSVTVAGTTPPVANTDYFPLTPNSWWSYNDGTNPDSIKTTNAYATTLGGNSYRAFVTTDVTGPIDTSYYRKDNATGFYYNYVATSRIDQTVLPMTFTQAGLDILFLKNTLTTNATWNSDFNGTLSGSIPAILRFKFTCVDANATVTVNGQSFTNVYKITELPQVGVSGTFTDLTTGTDFYYAKGIGLIWVNDQTGQQDILHWQVF